MLLFLATQILKTLNFRFDKQKLTDVRFEVCTAVGYKNPVRTSYETHYVSATESSQLMLCKI
jgi:hypothetical protein